MALYFVTKGDPPDSVLLVRAGNGRRAMEIAEGDQCARVHESGPDGVIGKDGNVLSGEAEPAAARRDRREVEITSLSDRGVRRYRDLDTGEEREELRE